MAGRVIGGDADPAIGVISQPRRRPVRVGVGGDGLEVARRGLEVLGHEVDGEVRVAGQGGVEDRLVLVGDVRPGGMARQVARPHAVELGGVVELAAQAFEDRASRGGRERSMEHAVCGQPLDVAGAVLEVHGCDRQPVVGGDEVGFPRDVALGDRLPQCQRLELDPHPGEIVEVVEGERADAEAALGRRLHQVLAGESGDRLAHDAEADAVLLGDLVEGRREDGSRRPNRMSDRSSS